MNYYKITFSPESGINASEFADNWNNFEPCREVAEAKTEMPRQGDFNLSEVAMLVTLFFVGNIATTALKELIKQAITEYFKNRQQTEIPAPKSEGIEIREIEQPDGNRLIVVVLKQ